MITSWEFKFFPAEKYPNRYRLRLKCTPEDIEELRSFLKDELKLDVSPPFNVLSSEYNLGIYIYELSQEMKSRLVESMYMICKHGIVEDTTLPKETSTETKVVKEPKIKEEIPDELGKMLEGLVEEISAKMVEPQVSEEKHRQARQSGQSLIVLGLPLNPKYTFENFVVGTNNRFTHAAALAVAENPGRTYNPLFIYGGVGLGKTHLMQAIGHYIVKKYPELKVIYLPSDKFVTQVIDSIRGGTIRELRENYSKVDVLLVDDVQFMAESESTQEEFFHIFNTLHQLGKQIVLTSDRPPKLLTTLEDRLRSRFEWGLIADIKSPSLETRVAILKKKGEEDNVNVDDNILLYIASKLKSNIRELEGFLKRISAYAAINNQPIDMTLVKQLMSELLPEEELTDEEKAIVRSQQKETVVEEPHISAVPTPAKTSVTEKGVQEKSIKQKVFSVEEIYKTSQQSIPTMVEQTGQAQVQPPSSITVDDQKFYQDFETNINTVEAAFFYPENAVQQLSLVKQKFAEVIKKHNLKYKIATAFDRPYNLDNINYRMFAELCKTNKVNVCIVVSPPEGSSVSSEEFYSNLLPHMESEGISLEYISWKELTKEYRYLNLALDIALSKFKPI
ncbi:MAG: chromosomal replication initiator protein DnaA [Elusimicrobiota bacterium]|nr:chromosomal replication initiator protein DnaA [Elusimicrobiota bacterium]